MKLLFTKQMGEGNMNIKTALLILGLALVFALGMVSNSTALADDSNKAAASVFNLDDPNMQADDERLKNAAGMDATLLSPATCPSGVCYKNTSGDVGFNLVRPILPDGVEDLNDKTAKPIKK